MNRAYLQLGKAGDLCNVLPILQKAAADSGAPVKLVVAKAYAGLVDGLRDIRPVIWPGDWQDARGALAFAKKQFREVICLSTFGKDFPIERKTPSFAIEQYERANLVESWDTLPLTLPRNGFKAKHTDILFADHSESAPFRFKDDLAERLQKRFPSHSFQRLSELRLKKQTDFLAYYDNARVLVSVDTLHLNLSRASTLPVVALVRHLPSRWHGLAYQKRFRLHVRYGDYEARREELLQTVADVLDRKPVLTPRVLPTKYPHGYNPTLIRWQGRDLLVYRYHPNKDWRTALALWDGCDTFPIRLPDAMQAYTAEDPRLFIHHDKLHIAYVAADVRAGLFRSVVGYGELIFKDGQWRIENFIQPKYGKNDWGGMEKNWVWFSHNKRLFAIYECADLQSVLEVVGPTVINVHRSKALTWPYGIIRGGSMVRDGDGWLRFFHSHNADMKDMSRVYRLGAVRMDGELPFRMRQISAMPILSGNERWIPNCAHWKPNVLFPAGAIQDGDGWRISVGLNDCESGMIQVTERQLNTINPPPT